MSSAKKILLVHLFSNGDCLYATAIARQIKHDYPGCHLTWGIAGFCKSILVGNPHVDEVMEINSVAKNDIVAYRKLKAEMFTKKEAGVYDEVFFTVTMDDNQMYYDGCIRTCILNAYPHKITQGIKPVVNITAEERERVHAWMERTKLSSFKNVILFEFAPQSGQLPMTTELALSISDKITAKKNDTAIILSSSIKINAQRTAILDGSELTYRETIYLSNYCTLLLGCSSGITWGTTSTGGKMLPMVQILNPWVAWVNPISRDFERQGISTEHLIELMELEEDTIVNCLDTILNCGFTKAKQLFHRPLPLHFKTTRRIIYNLFCYRQFNAIIKHLQVNAAVYGWHPLLLKEAALALAGFPVKLVYNKVMKNLKKA